MNYLLPGELAIFLLTLPAIVSPLILVPLAESWGPLPDGLRPLVTLCAYPRLWAGAATLVAVVWIGFSRASRARKILSAAIAIISWIPAWTTAHTIAGLERF
jgi:hypothetical protein